MVNSQLNYAIYIGLGIRLHSTKQVAETYYTYNHVQHTSYTSPLFKSLRLLTLHDMLKVNVLKFYHRYLHNELPPYFYNFNIRAHGDTHSYDTRNSGQLHIERTRTEYAGIRLRIYLPTLINDIPSELLATIATRSLQDFTKIAKQFLIEQYTVVCSIPGCYICART